MEAGFAISQAVVADGNDGTDAVFRLPDLVVERPAPRPSPPPQPVRAGTQTVIEPPSPSFTASESRGEDEAELEQMGYQQELMRGMNGFMSFAISFTVCAIIPGIAQLYNFALNTGGPAVMVWCWMVASLGALATGLCLAEICSTYPQAGSVYFWAAQLSSEAWAPFASYFCGWINLLGNLANSASFASGFVTILAAAIEMLNGSVLPIPVQVALSIFVVVLWGLQNIFRIDLQGWINAAGAVLQVFGSFLIVILALALSSSKTSPSFVFTSTYNGTGFSSLGYVSLIGLVPPLYCYGGFEAAAHLAEETHSANRAAPKGIMYCLLLSFFAGFFMIVGLLFCTPSDSSALALGYPTGIDLLLGNSLNCADPTCNGAYPPNPLNVAPSSSSPGASAQAMVNLLWYCGGQIGGFIMSIVLALMVYVSGMSALTATSRMVFAIARDNGLPFSKHIHAVNSRTKSPLQAVLWVVIFASIMLLLPLGNSTAFAQLTSMSSIGYNLSYALPILFRLTFSGSSFRQSAFSLGRASKCIGWIAVIWCFSSTFVLFLPQAAPVQTTNMNYSCAVVGGVIIIALFFWVLSGRQHFSGPKREQPSSRSDVVPSSPVRLSSLARADAPPPPVITRPDSLSINI